MKDDYVKFLTSIYQNTCTALQSIEELMPKTDDEEFKKELSNEYTNYDLISRECEMLATAEDLNLKDNTVFEKLRLWSSINLTTITDKTIRHLAEMMLLGSVMGLIQCIKDMSDYKGVSQDLNDLCQKLYDLEEENYQKLKNFLK